MRKLLFILSLIGGLLSVPTNLMADEGQKKTIRMFLNTGEQLDFDAEDIDSITNTFETQTIWYSGTSRAVAIESIDSIWYISPALKLTTDGLNFGKVAVGNKKMNVVTLTNTSDYTENYFLLADGVFSTANSGKNLTIAAGESQSVELTFEPTDTVAFTGSLILTSNALNNGLLRFPLVGEGVAVDSLEEDVVLSPVEENIEVLLPIDQDPESLAGFKIVNSYGEYPISTTAAARARRAPLANGESEYACEVPAMKSANGLQLHVMMRDDIPYLLAISKRNEQLKISAEQTAISLLMTSPLLMTNNEDEYNNTVETIRKLDAFPDFVKAVKEKYEAGINNQQCPNFAAINTEPLLRELFSKVLDDSELTKSMISLKDVGKNYSTVSYRVCNDLKRVLHIYPGRVKMASNTGVITEKDESSRTLLEVCEWLLSSGDYVAAELREKEDKEEIEFIKELQSMVKEIEDGLVMLGLSDVDSHIVLPIILDSQKSNYWKIVKGSLQGDKSSPFHVESEEITTVMDDYAKAQVDIYGMGRLNKPWSQFTNSEKLRIMLVMMHGGYKDVIMPIIGLVRGVKDVWNASSDISGPDKYNYDFRYGARKYPECALVAKLLYDFYSDKDNVKKLNKNLENHDWWEVAKDMMVFAFNTVCKMPSEDPQDKRSYTNLIYNTYKKYSKNSATSKAFREEFKAAANEITSLHTLGFIGATINMTERLFDVTSAYCAVKRTNVKETFTIDKSDQASIEMVKPHMAMTPDDLFGDGGNSVVEFEWKTFKASYITVPFRYALEMIVDTPDKIIRKTVIDKIDGNHVAYDMSKLPELNKARRVMFRIIAQNTVNNAFIPVMTDDILLVSFTKDPQPRFVDLGLPSGTLWADCNLGASQAVDFGNYYAWGETQNSANGKNEFSWGSYSYCKGSSNKLTKYCTKSVYGNNGFTDNLTELQGSDDAAASLWGYWYSIPTKEEWEELINYCNWQWVGGASLSDGILVTSKQNGAHIFLPVGGYRSGFDTYDRLSSCHYWSSTLDEHSPDDAWFMNVYLGDKDIYDYYRCQGRAIRPVLHPAPLVTPNAVEQAPLFNTASKLSSQPLVKHENGMTISVRSTSSSK